MNTVYPAPGDSVRITKTMNLTQSKAAKIRWRIPAGTVGMVIRDRGNGLYDVECMKVQELDSSKRERVNLPVSGQVLVVTARQTVLPLTADTAPIGAEEQ